MVGLEGLESDRIPMKSKRSVDPYPVDADLAEALSIAAGLYGDRVAKSVREAFRELGIQSFDDVCRHRQSDFTPISRFGNGALRALRFMMSRAGRRLKDEPALPSLLLAADEAEGIRDRLLMRLGAAYKDGRAVNLSANEVFVLGALLEGHLEQYATVR